VHIKLNATARLNSGSKRREAVLRHATLLRVKTSVRKGLREQLCSHLRGEGSVLRAHTRYALQHPRTPLRELKAQLIGLFKLLKRPLLSLLLIIFLGFLKLIAEGIEGA
jgi:hypothetical protein